MFLALSPCAFRRACVEVRKSRVIVSWHVAHSSDPTNSDPGMLGGARIEWLDSKLLQERKTRVVTAPPATSHPTFFRWPPSHRINLDSRTPWSLAGRFGAWL